MQSLDIHVFTYEPRHDLLPLLTNAFADSGGWVLERKTLSATHVEFRLEIQIGGVLELYAAIVETGVELTRAGHEILTELCTRRRHLPAGTEATQLVNIRMELSFLEEVSLYSLLASGSGLA